MYYMDDWLVVSGLDLSDNIGACASNQKMRK